MKPSDTVRRKGGLAATHELLTTGWTSYQLTHAVAAGDIVRVRQGWYAVPETPEPLQQAVRVGGRLSCISGALRHGLPALASPLLHVAVARHSCRLRSKDDKANRLIYDNRGVIVHWTDDRDSDDRMLQSPIRCVVDMIRCQRPELVIAAADAGIRLGLFTLREWRETLFALPDRLATLLGSVDARAESITESLTRVRLCGLGVQPRLQVAIAGVGRVDMVIGERLVIELDGWAYHADRDQFELDRRRDARLSARGFHVLRFSYQQVMHAWSEVKAAILAAIARGDHLS
jgi:very-short-patch-repair endonuclease